MIKVETIPTKVPQVEIIYDFVTPQEEQFLSRVSERPPSSLSLSHSTSLSSLSLQRIDEVGGDDRQVQLGNKNWGWKHLNGRRSMVWGKPLVSLSHSFILSLSFSQIFLLQVAPSCPTVTL